MFTDVIIMAGGSGTRLWPASNKRTPKQFLPISSGASFFDSALERAYAILNDGETGAEAGQLLIIAGPAHLSHIHQALSKRAAPDRDRTVIISEPLARNTAPALACACVYLRLSFGEKRRALVLTSDHVISELDEFLQDAEAADEIAASGALAVFGIAPSAPATGFGYIEAAASVPSIAAPGRVFSVAAFREKPDQQSAEAYVASGRYYWNSGMFGFSVAMMLDELREHAPAIYAPFSALEAPPVIERRKGEPRLINVWPGLEAAYASAPSLSIDYAVAEKTEKAAVICAAFLWRDIGSWDEYIRYREEAAPNPSSAAVFPIDSTSCYIDSDLPVALCGVEDLIVVVRRDSEKGAGGVLICRKGRSQDVKRAVEAIKKAGRTDLL